MSNPDQFKNSCMNLFRLKVLVTLIRIGDIFYLLYQAAWILIWVRAAYTDLFTNPDRTPHKRLAILYQRVVGRNVILESEIEHPRLYRIGARRLVPHLEAVGVRARGPRTPTNSDPESDSESD